jgi:hydroxymethylpyrimidine/phosphomethylpyrimidine kinase
MVFIFKMISYSSCSLSSGTIRKRLTTVEKPRISSKKIIGTGASFSAIILAKILIIWAMAAPTPKLKL